MSGDASGASCGGSGAAAAASAESGVKPFLDILSRRGAGGCGGEHAHAHAHAPPGGEGVAARSSRGPVRVVVEGELTPEMVRRALAEGDEEPGSRPAPVVTSHSVERVEPPAAASGGALAASLAARLFALHERRVAAFRSLEDAGNALVATTRSVAVAEAALDGCDGADADATAAEAGLATAAAVRAFQTSMADVTARMANVSEGFRLVGQEASSAVDAGSDCAELAAIAAAVTAVQAVEKERLQLAAKRQVLLLTGARNSAEGEDLADTEARLSALGLRAQAAVDALRDEVADLMLG